MNGQGTAQSVGSLAPQPDHEPQDEPATELIEYLEPDQLVIETFRPVPRAALTRNVAVALWGLRVFVVLVSLMVIYTFIVNLH